MLDGDFLAAGPFGNQPDRAGKVLIRAYKPPMNVGWRHWCVSCYRCRRTVGYWIEGWPAAIELANTHLKECTGQEEYHGPKAE